MYPLMKLNFSKLVKGFSEDLTCYSVTSTVSKTKKKQLDKMEHTTALLH